MRRILAGAVGLIAAAATVGVMLISSPAAGAAAASRAGPTHTSARSAARSDAALTWPTVRYGDRGNRVFAIQYLLRSYGYAVRPSGFFGGVTRHDVAHFQRVRGLRGTGVVGAATWRRLIVPLRYRSRGNAVRGLQQNLHYAYGYRRVLITGYFGPITRNSVLKFQRRYRIATDGIVGLVTWNAIIVNER